ncbi:unnamed protein product [Natator depressus]
MLMAPSPAYPAAASTHPPTHAALCSSGHLLPAVTSEWQCRSHSCPYPTLRPGNKHCLVVMVPKEGGLSLALHPRGERGWGGPESSSHRWWGPLPRPICSSCPREKSEASEAAGACPWGSERLQCRDRGWDTSPRRHSCPAHHSAPCQGTQAAGSGARPGRPLGGSPSVGARSSSAGHPTAYPGFGPHSPSLGGAAAPVHQVTAPLASLGSHCSPGPRRICKCRGQHAPSSHGHASLELVALSRMVPSQCSLPLPSG